MLIAVTDTETTGTEENDQVLELAIGFVDPERVPSVQETIFERHETWLIRPTVAVHPAARGTHHITDRMLENAPTMSEHLETWSDPFLLNENAVIFCAHNAEFDRRLIEQSVRASGWQGLPILPELTIDTWVCARHLWPEAPGYGNQTLRYWLGLDERYPEMTKFLEIMNLPPHRAAPDVVVTGYLLWHMLQENPADELLRLTETPVLQVTCNMPKHRGKTWAEVARVDPGYMRWMLDQGPEVKLPGGAKSGFDADTIHTLKYHLGLLER